MKKISLCKKLSLGLGTCAVAVPLVLTATSCSTNHIDVKYISFDDFAAVTLDKNASLTDKIDTGNFSYDKLLLGSKKFFDGNYFLFVGSNMFPNTNTFFAGEEDRRTTQQWFDKDAYLHDSLWNKDISDRANDQDLLDTNFGFVTFIDDFDLKFHDKEGHEIVIVEEDQQIHEVVGPFDKWTPTLISQTKEYNRDVLHYEWDDESVDEGDYIREDESAKSYREFCKRGLSFFPTVEGGRTKTFDVGDNNKTSLMLVYKEGKLKDILDMPTKAHELQLRTDNDPATLYGAMYKYFPLEEPEEPEPEPEKI